MKPVRSGPRIERSNSSKNRVARNVTGLVLAIVCLSYAISLPGYCSWQQQEFYPTTPPAAPGGWGYTGNLNSSRYGHTATLLADGKVLVAGGGGLICQQTSATSRFCYATTHSSAELYDPNTGTWNYTRDMSRRVFHSATLLRNGEVLVAGGLNWYDHSADGERLNSAELYDPIRGKWRPTGSFKTIKNKNSTTLLTNGKVLAAGSHKDAPGPDDCTAELYDPATGTWETVSSPQNCGTLITLHNGKVLNVSGGLVDLYDPDLDTWSSTGQPNVIRSTSTVILLANGKVLLTGSTSGDSSAFAAELYDPNTETWSITGSPKIVGGSATRLSDGRVLIVLAGGYDASQPNAAQLYDPDTEMWSPTSPLNVAPRDFHTATLLADGKVLVAGGIDFDFSQVPLFHNTVELYGTIRIPTITGAFVEGKRLLVRGDEFKIGSVILLNGEEQKTSNDLENASTTLIGKKTGKRIKPGDRLQVRNPDGALSNEFTFLECFVNYRPHFDLEERYETEESCNSSLFKLCDHPWQP